MELFDKNLLTEFSGSSPAGDYIRYDEIFDDLKEQRRKYVETLKGSGHNHDLQSTCDAFRDQVVGLIDNKSKDFILTFWLIEATTILRCYQGLEASSVFLRDFFEYFWNVAHPIEDGHDLKMLAIHWFDKEFSITLKFIHLFGGDNSFGQSFSKQSVDALHKRKSFWANTPNRTMTRDQKSKYSEFQADWENYKAFCLSLDVSKLKDNLVCLDNAIINFEKTEKLIEDFNPESISSLERISVTLRALRGTLKQTVRSLEKSETADEEHVSETVNESKAEEKASLDAQKENDKRERDPKVVVEEYIRGIVDKKDVYEIISLLVEKLTVVDPNSPNVQLGKKMLIIKDMNFLDILEELVDDERTRRHVIKFFGLS